ncbi:hypothetical protein FHT76_006628 [Rhizobium sp. BK176]|nr:hypothetical protein [Rhizobium sp. BK176]
MATETGIEATIKVVEPTGSETHVAVELDGRELTWVVGDRVELRASKRSGSPWKRQRLTSSTDRPNRGLET